MLSKGTMRRLAACSAVLCALLAVMIGAAPYAGATSQANAPVTISLWPHTHPPMIAEFKKLIKEYEQLHPNVTVQYQTIPNTDFATKMLTSMGTSTGPEIINMDDGQM